MAQSEKYGRTYHYPFSPGSTSDDRINRNYQGKDTYVRTQLKGLPVISLDEIRKQEKITPTDESGNGKVIQLVKGPPVFAGKAAFCMECHQCYPANARPADPAFSYL